MFGAGSGFGAARGRLERATAPRQRSSPVHYPYVRPLQLDWQELPTGFRASRNDPYRFEVICAACGDIDGPTEYQPYSVQELRGPYESKRIAEKVSQRHHVGSTFSVKHDKAGKREQLALMFPLKMSRDRTSLLPRTSGADVDLPKDRSSSWHQVLWVRTQARWIRWRK